MTPKKLSLPGSGVQANEPSSLISRVRQGRQARPARASNGAQDAHLSANTGAGATNAVAVKARANTVCPAHVPHLEKLIRWVRSYSKDRLMKETEVLTTISRSKAAMRRDVSLGLFPKQIKTGPKSSAWRESEVMGWVEATTVLSRVANPGFDMKEFVAALDVAISGTAEASA
ncbi:AlpA family transcriptional regulator [Paraburkholderia sp. BL21I4N1]|uniref:helix-turn-helix transcriptional regulator n=1 Tax=Paraburkholderia sp. BL21I4N1 TaxID=1938801 RepID=UPI000D436F8E|nr:AlpA family phage regulatory protein [Paraburkholderia sp. BL21I4N1]PQV52177.1 AlpA family transcriptional regulator [Paraburkholderia sp. BL21I4N1]